MRVAVTGAGGRLGTALRKSLAVAEHCGAIEKVLAWDLPDHDLDDPASAERLVSTHRPDLVIHGAAWTDVDGCAREPELAMRRNGLATGELARAVAARGAAMILVSTNEVFDGKRTDGRSYEPTDEPAPGNAYGRSKLAGERLAREAFDATGPEFERAVADRDRGVPDRHAPVLAIVRTSWLFGPPGPDFPKKILAAARRARDAGETLSLVGDEIGCPTYSFDLAWAIESLVAAEAAQATGEIRGIHHVVNAGHASRAEWAREVLRLAGVDVPTRDVPLSTWPRPSTPPAWGVMAPTPLSGGPLRSWQEATAQYMEWVIEEERRS